MATGKSNMNENVQEEIELPPSGHVDIPALIALFSLYFHFSQIVTSARL
jgi:hypothetical protein